VYTYQQSGIANKRWKGRKRKSRAGGRKKIARRQKAGIECMKATE